MPVTIGQTLDGKYKITRLIGQGGMGSVYEGVHQLIHRRVAIKVLRPSEDPSAGARFQQEARAAGLIGNDHILEVHDIGTLEDSAKYMVCEYLDGESLSQRIRQHGRLAPQEVTPIAIQILAGLGAAHEAGIIHRDLKPDNIFLLREKAGQRDFVKIIDFGISKFAQNDGDLSMTKTGMLVGTPHYMSPEQARGKGGIDARTDLYAVAVMLYEAVAGRVPFLADSFNDLLFKVALEDPPALESLVPGIDPSFTELIRKGMAREPHNRFQTAADFALAIDTWSRGAGIGSGTAVISGPSPAVSAAVEAARRSSSQLSPPGIGTPAPAQTPSPRSSPNQGSGVAEPPRVGSDTVAVPDPPRVSPNTVAVPNPPHVTPNTVALPDPPGVTPHAVAASEPPRVPSDPLAASEQVSSLPAASNQAEATPHPSSALSSTSNVPSAGPSSLAGPAASVAEPALINDPFARTSYPSATETPSGQHRNPSLESESTQLESPAFKPHDSSVSAHAPALTGASQTPSAFGSTSSGKWRISGVGKSPATWFIASGALLLTLVAVLALGGSTTSDSVASDEEQVSDLDAPQTSSPEPEPARPPLAPNDGQTASDISSETTIEADDRSKNESDTQREEREKEDQDKGRGVTQSTQEEKQGEKPSTSEPPLTTPVPPPPSPRPTPAPSTEPRPRPQSAPAPPPSPKEENKQEEQHTKEKERTDWGY